MRLKDLFKSRYLTAFCHLVQISLSNLRYTEWQPRHLYFRNHHLRVRSYEYSFSLNNIWSAWSTNSSAACTSDVFNQPSWLNLVEVTDYLILIHYLYMYYVYAVFCCCLVLIFFFGSHLTLLTLLNEQVSCYGITTTIPLLLYLM